MPNRKTKLTLDLEQLRAITQSLNETLGTIDETEFETRLGVEKPKVEALLRHLLIVYDRTAGEASPLGDESMERQP